MTIGLEHTADDNPAIDRNFDKLRSSLIDASGVTGTTSGQTLTLRFGIATATFTASARSAGFTVSHGLGTTPECIIAMSVGSTMNICVNYVSGSRTDTDFDLVSETVDGTAISGTAAVFWLAMG